MPKLTLKERWLYSRKKYDKLSKLMRRTDEGAARFNELCIQDTGLQNWLGRVPSDILALLEKNTKLKAEIKEAFDRESIGRVFDLLVIHQKKGYVTLNETAETFGLTVQEMQTAIATHPAVFTGLRIRGVQQNNRSN